MVSHYLPDSAGLSGLQLEHYLFPSKQDLEPEAKFFDNTGEIAEHGAPAD